MIRRSFLKTMAGAFTAALVNLRPTIDNERLMIPFCDPDYQRFDFASPFGIESLTYATDGKAMIRAEIARREEYGERRLPSNIADIWRAHWNHGGQWVPVQEYLTPTLHNDDDCPECGDRRIDHGDDWPILTNLLDYDPDTNTSRDPSCVLCKGRSYPGLNVCVIDGVHHNAFKLRRIAALPNAVICPSLSVADSLLFKADGFEGISLGYTDQ